MNRYNHIKKENGFIALTLIITVASLLLAFSYTQSIEIAHFFDSTRLKEYRLMNYYNAYSCIDQAILRISHDYFYLVSTSTEIPELFCAIDSIRIESGFRIIETRGIYKNIIVKRKAKVRVRDDAIESVEIII